MDFRELLDRNDNTQFTILLHLVDLHAPAEKAKIASDLGLSAFILERSLEELNDVMTGLNLEMRLDLQSQAGSVRLASYHWDQVEKIYHYFLKKSLSYQLIFYLYQNRTYTVVGLEEVFSISEASVYRQIATINKAITEFKVVIKHGKFEGDNLRLSHFFFQFFWNSMSMLEIEQHITDPEIIRFIDLLELKFNRPFTQSAKMRISLWCRILKFSATRKVAVSPTVLALAEEFQADPFYQLVRESYFFSLSYSAVFGSDYKATAIYTFLSTGFQTAPQCGAV